MPSRSPRGLADMTPYTIHLLGPDDETVASERRWFEHDDHALDTVGLSDHPDKIEVWQGERLVARFPRWPLARPVFDR